MKIDAPKVHFLPCSTPMGGFQFFVYFDTPSEKSLCIPSAMMNFERMQRALLLLDNSMMPPACVLGPVLTKSLMPRGHTTAAFLLNDCSKALKENAAGLSTTDIDSWPAAWKGAAKVIMDCIENAREELADKSFQKQP